MKERWLRDRLDDAARRGLFTDAEALVGRAGRVVFRERRVSEPVRRYFDLASLTKPLCTGLLTLLAWQEQRIDPCAPLGDFLPGTDIARVPLGDFLRHRSGLAAWHDFAAGRLGSLSRTAFEGNRRAIVKEILSGRYMLARRGRVVYSDIGYILLGAVLEATYGRRIDRLFRDKIAAPLGIGRELFFRPLPPPSRPRPSAFVPAEFCPRRARLIRGEVMDENAWVIGGVAGHAGLFGDATAIHRLLRELRLASEGRSRLFRKDAFDLFCRPDPKRPANARFFTPAGFDTPTRPRSQSGRLFSRRTIGHLGYSGASFWWDLDRDAWVVLLTNRCHAGRENPAFAAWRPGFHDALMNRLIRGADSP